jgi:acetylornithine deacetylase/succinyl-diaminopimelate desuccinylase-like protein
VKPKRTLRHVLLRLEELSEGRRREYLTRVAPIVRPSCPVHGWTAPGPGSLNASAVASLCPACREDRKRRAREEATPETVTIGLYEGSPRAQQLWQEYKDRAERAGYVMPGSATETLAVRAIDELRQEELLELAETAGDRRRANAEYWGRRLRTSNQQVYTPHPARAGRM